MLISEYDINLIEAGIKEVKTEIKINYIYDKDKIIKNQKIRNLYCDLARLINKIAIEEDCAVYDEEHLTHDKFINDHIQFISYP
jgi:hypothetical protein